jgi:hypothetical protein
MFGAFVVFVSAKELSVWMLKPEVGGRKSDRNPQYREVNSQVRAALLTPALNRLHGNPSPEYSTITPSHSNLAVRNGSEVNLWVE